MTDPRTYLQDVLAKAEAATEGPWEVYSVPATRKEAGYVAVEASETEVRIARYEGGHFDGAHIASSRTTVPVMARALLAVLARHVPITVKIAAHDGSVTERVTCRHCLWLDGEGIYNPSDVPLWPCPDYTTITTELAKEDQA